MYPHTSSQDSNTITVSITNKTDVERAFCTVQTFLPKDKAAVDKVLKLYKSVGSNLTEDQLNQLTDQAAEIMKDVDYSVAAVALLYPDKDATATATITLNKPVSTPYLLQSCMTADPEDDRKTNNNYAAAYFVG